MLCPDAATHPGADKDPGCFHHPGFFLPLDVDKIALLKRFCGNDTIIVEVQIRTIAQDFWASLEHKIYYKFEGSAPEYISKDLRACAEFVAELDDKMLSLNEAIQSEALRKAEKPDSKKEE